MKNSINSFISKFSIVFTFTIITYSVFDAFTYGNNSFQDIVLQCFGLSIIFSLIMSILDYLTSKIKILSTNHFIWIQYIILVSIIVFWAILFNWGNWENRLYVIIFIGVFTIIYLIIYFLIGLSNKEQDLIINEKLKKYQKDI